MSAAVKNALISVFLVGVPAWSHHVLSKEFDLKKLISLQGTVVRMEWVNPHAWIHLDVKSPSGQIANWLIEGASPSVLFRRGFTKQALETGTQIVVTGYPAKDGYNRAGGIDVTFQDGKRLSFAGSDPVDGAKLVFKSGQTLR